MPLTKRECAYLRGVITRLHNGPEWYSETPSPMLYELRARNRIWIDGQVRELQGMLPFDERVKLLPPT